MTDSGTPLSHGVEHLNKDYAVPGWVLGLVTLATPLVLGAIGWGEVSARVTLLEDRVSRQSAFMSDAAKKIDESSEKLTVRITEAEAARVVRSDVFADKLGDLGSRVAALTAQMVFLNTQLAHGRELPSVEEPRGQR